MASDPWSVEALGCWIVFRQGSAGTSVLRHFGTDSQEELGDRLDGSGILNPDTPPS